MPAEIFANTMICLINQASYLLWQQLKSLEKDNAENNALKRKK
jgi:four helix bundle suffix protein